MSDPSPSEQLFTANEQALIDQAEAFARNSGDNPDLPEIIRLRLRNLIEKYRELSKRDRFHTDRIGNSSQLPDKNSAYKAQCLQQLLDQIS
ncbi:MAG: hypothetical protein AAF446_11935 [Pseudomonadota bacterium]